MTGPLRTRNEMSNVGHSDGGPETQPWQPGSEELRDASRRRNRLINPRKETTIEANNVIAARVSSRKLPHRRRRRILATVALLVLASAAASTTVSAPLSSGSDSIATASAPQDPAPRSNPTSQPQGWVTTADQSQLMTPIPVTSTSIAASTTPADITLNLGYTAQTIEGFGAALTQSSAQVLLGLPAAQRAAVMTELFAPTGPVRLNVLRIPVGASDFVPGTAFTFDDMPPGQTDLALEHFSTSADQRTLQPLLQQALTLNPRLKIIASPWSPPAWMKTTDTLQGGQLKDDAATYRSYADYLLRFIQDYQHAGIPIWGITVQNEPQQRQPDGYPGTDMPVTQEAALIQTLGPALQQAGLRTVILGYDHNWSLHPADAASTPAGQDPAYQYPADLLQTPAAKWLAGTAYHCYYGDASRQTELHQQFPDKGIWVTECSGTRNPGDSPAATFAATLGWQANNLLIAATRNWAKTVLTFNLALDPHGGPHTGGCDTCTPVVTVNLDGTITRNAEYYLLAQAARFITPGAVRVGSDSDPSLAVAHVAFRNPNRSLVLIAYNNADHPTPLTIGAGNTTLTATVPPRSLLSITWPAT